MSKRSSLESQRLKHTAAFGHVQDETRIPSGSTRPDPSELPTGTYQIDSSASRLSREVGDAPHYREQYQTTSSSAPRTPAFPQQYFHPPMSQQPSAGLPGPGLLRYHEMTRPPAQYGETPGIHLGAHAQGPPSAKRAYRQRRKDPSCDACRERKVKCDATESASCTECKSRNVNCQFTKETNRRMTSIKQNQDLSKELANAQAQIAKLEALIPSGRDAEHSATRDPQSNLSAEQSRLREPNSAALFTRPGTSHWVDTSDSSPSSPPAKRPKVNQIIDVSKVATNLVKYGHGLSNVHVAKEHPSLTPTNNSLLPRLPPKEESDVLLRNYLSFLHPLYPLIPWATFERQYEDAYRNESLQNVPQVWSALLFAILACGSMYGSRFEGQRYLETSKFLFDLSNDDATFDHARCAVLYSLFLIESGKKSAAWIWLGVAIRIGFDIKLNSERGPWSQSEIEERRQLWWCIYSFDCLVSLELGRPNTIDEDYFDVQTPSVTTELANIRSSVWHDPAQTSAAPPFLLIVRLSGGIARLSRLLSGEAVSASVLQAYDGYFNDLIGNLPSCLQPHTDHFMDPNEITPVVYLQNARLMLHRRNMSPACDQNEKQQALNACVAIARDTASYLRRWFPLASTRTSRDPSSRMDVEQASVAAASAILCTHVWRCTLFLLFAGDFETAWVCICSSATIGDTRPVNTSCGQYLEFFINELVQRSQSARTHLREDEEMLIYVAPDLQSSVLDSWIWQAGKDNLRSGHSSTENPFEGASAPQEGGRGSHSSASGRSIAVSEGGNIWRGWETLIRTTEKLIDEQRERRMAQRAPVETQAGRIHSPPVQLPPMIASDSPTKSTPRDRLSIKDLL